MAKQVKVYSTPTCPYCHKAKDFLNEKKVEFDDIDVAENQGVPVLDIDGKIIVGFDQEALEEALG